MGDKEMAGYITSFTAFVFMCRIPNRSTSVIDRKDLFPSYSSCILMQMCSCQFLRLSPFPTVNTMSSLHSHGLSCYRHIIQFFSKFVVNGPIYKGVCQGNGRPIAGI
jgi:hypothetical protein